MSITNHIAKQLREVYFGGNWTYSNLKEHLMDVTWQQATKKVYHFNTIAVLTYHISYFISAVIPVLKGEPLTAKDKYSFTHPPILSKEDWDKFLTGIWEDAETLANLIEQLHDDKLMEVFSEEKYGTYYRNFHGIIEHAHYHLGQIVILKKIIQTEEKSPS